MKGVNSYGDIPGYDAFLERELEREHRRQRENDSECVQLEPDLWPDSLEFEEDYRLEVTPYDE